MHSKKRNVVVTRGLFFSCMNEQLKCVEILLRNSLYSLEYYVALRETSIYHGI